MKKIIFLRSARLDFAEIQSEFKRTHSAARFALFKQSFKSLFEQIRLFPLAGVVPDECAMLELEIRQRIVEKIRVIYQVTDDLIVIRMFLPTHRDFSTHLVERMLRA